MRRLRYRPDLRARADAELGTYKTPGPLDMPDDVAVIIVDEPDPKGPFGAKGAGETGLVGVAPAIANAVFDAVGVRIRSLPITPEKVLDALDRKSQSGSGHRG